MSLDAGAESYMHQIKRFSNFCKCLDCAIHLVFGVYCRELYADAGFSHGYDGVGESADKDAFFKKCRGHIRRDFFISQHDGRDRMRAIPSERKPGTRHGRPEVERIFCKLCAQALELRVKILQDVEC